MRRILVTGGAGFIGSNFVRRALTKTKGRQPVGVTVLDKLTYAGNLENLAPISDSPGFRFVRGDICDAQLLAGLLPGHDAVVHFAAESHVDRSIWGGGEFVTTNVLGTQTLLQASLRAGVEPFIHVSTDEVYGSIATGSSSEDHPLLPNSLYAASKAGSDLLARAYHHTHGLDVRITRCSNTFGAYQFPEKIIPLFVTKLLDGVPVPLYGDGLNVREWLHVDDHCLGIELVLQRGRGGETYNIGGGTELTNRELTLRILDAMGADESRIRPVADRKGHDRRYSVDMNKSRRELGYEPQVPFDRGLTQTIRWYRDHQHWWRPLKGTDE